MDSQIDVHYPKATFGKDEVYKKKEAMPMKEHWQMEEDKKYFILKFKPDKIKQLKEFRKSQF